jgi:Protein of unknown function (DUF2721)
MALNPAAGDIAHAIQLAIAPVFLLTGVAALLGVMAARLARVIDRGRYFEERWAEMNAAARAVVQLELGGLEARRRACSWAINFCTGAALLICLVIVTLFVEEFLVTPLKWLSGALFVASMLGVICGLGCFLREVYLATHTTRIDLRRFET